MGVFRRSKRSGEDTEPEDVGVGAVEVAGSAEDAAGLRERGPWDLSEVPERGRRVDLGALWLPGREGMELRMEIEKTSKIVSAAAVSLKGSALQLQVFAAPRTEGIWDEIRAEIAESVTKQGGTGR